MLGPAHWWQAQRTRKHRCDKEPDARKTKRRTAPSGQQVTLRPNAKAAAAHKPKKKAKGQGKGGGSKRAATMRNGDKIGAGWNDGKCSVIGDSCPAGKHVCNAFTENNKGVCAMRNHMGKDRTKSVRA